MISSDLSDVNNEYGNLGIQSKYCEGPIIRNNNEKIMKINSDKIYNISPIFLQNILVSAYGAKLFYERYFNKDTAFFNNLIESQWFDDSKIRNNQLSKLHDLLFNACTTVKYYRSNNYCLDLNTNKKDSFDALNSFPILEKETVRTNWHDFISSKYNHIKLIKLNTSGTTGKSLKVYLDYSSRRASYCFTSRYHMWAGLSGSNNATFGGRVIVPPGQRTDIFWRYNAAMNNYLFSSYHMSDKYLPLYVKKLNAINPQYIEAYPSAVYVLAKFIDENNLKCVSPKAVLTSGETLYDYQRELIERVFACQIFDQYGCTEQSLFISQCEKGTYHVHPEYGIVEILDDVGSPVGPGVAGRVVCTSFMNKAMPLIRYDIGDTAEWGEGVCECGRNFPIINKICGRQDDYIVTPDGQMVGRLDPVFKGIDSVKLAQIVQKKLNLVVLRLVPGKTFNLGDKTKIVKELKSRLGESVEVLVEIVEDIPKTKNGKIKSVISLIGR